MTTEKRIQAERMITRATVKALLDAGFNLSVYNGEWELKHSYNATQILKSMFLCDEEHLFVYRDAARVGFVQFVYGNDGWDVIADNTTSLEPYIGEGTAVQQLIDKCGDSL